MRFFFDSRIVVVGIFGALLWGCGEAFSSAESGSSSATSTATGTTSSTASSSSGQGGESSSSVGTGGSSSVSTGTGGSGGEASCDPALVALRDDFNDNMTGAVWTPFSDIGTFVGEQNGEVFVDAAFGFLAAKVAGYVSTSPFDLHGCAVSISVKELCGTTKGYETLFVLQTVDGKSGLYMGVIDGNLTCFKQQNDNVTELVSYPYSSTKYWRMRAGADGFFYWETSNDGFDWQEQHSTAMPDFLTSVRVLFGARTEDVENMGKARFDDFNILPGN